jgi:hypothetical protein
VCDCEHPLEMAGEGDRRRDRARPRLVAGGGGAKGGEAQVLVTAGESVREALPNVLAEQPRDERLDGATDHVTQDSVLID